MLMDEPTSELDLHRQIQVLDFMRKQAHERGLLVFIAIHDLNQALHFTDQVVVIAGGTVQASGPSYNVITEQILREVYQIDARIERCSQGIAHVIVDGVV